MLYHKTPIPYRKRPAVYQKKATNTSTPAVRQVLMSMSTTSIQKSTYTQVPLALYYGKRANICQQRPAHGQNRPTKCQKESY